MGDTGRLYMKEIRNPLDKRNGIHHIVIDSFADNKCRDYCFAIFNGGGYNSAKPRQSITRHFGIAPDDEATPLSFESYMVLSDALKHENMKFNKKTGTLIYNTNKGD